MIKFSDYWHRIAALIKVVRKQTNRHTNTDGYDDLLGGV